MGPAFLIPNAIALIARTWPIGDKRAMVISINGACGPTGFVVGAMFSSIIATYSSWEWEFWATALVSTVITWLAYIIVPDTLAEVATPPGVDPPKFDFVGCFTGVSGLILVNFSLNQAPLVGWRTPYVYVTLIIGVLMTGIFFFAEIKLTKHPLVPMSGLQPQALMALACIAAGWATHGIWLYYLYLFLMNIRHVSPILATAMLSPVVPVGIAFALSTNTLIKKFHVSRVMLMAMLFFCFGIIFLSVAPPGQTYWGLTFLSILVTPGGMNLSFPAGTILLSNAMPREHQGKAASLVGTIVNYSIASGLGIGGSIERAVNGDGSKLLQGYQAVWYLGIVFSGIGVAMSLGFAFKSRGKARL